MLGDRWHGQVTIVSWLARASAILGWNLGMGRVSAFCWAPLNSSKWSVVVQIDGFFLSQRSNLDHWGWCIGWHNKDEGGGNMDHYSVMRFIFSCRCFGNVGFLLSWVFQVD